MTNAAMHLKQEAQLMLPVSEMTYTVSSGTLNPTIPYYQLMLTSPRDALEVSQGP